MDGQKYLRKNSSTSPPERMVNIVLEKSEAIEKPSSILKVLPFSEFGNNSMEQQKYAKAKNIIVARAMMKIMRTITPELIIFRVKALIKKSCTRINSESE
jgi:hypothetical protein